MTQHNPNQTPFSPTNSFHAPFTPQASSSSHDNQNDNEQLNYYNEYCRLSLTNTVLAVQLKELSIEKNELIAKLNRLEKRSQELQNGSDGNGDEKKRRMRRNATEIARHYKCRVEGCSKSYGSEGSLNQHLKIKHPDIFQKLGNLLVNKYSVKDFPQLPQSD